MKQIQRQFLKALVILACMLPWAAADALETFDRAGVITAVGYDMVTVQQQEYRIAPGVKLESHDASRKRVSDLRSGDVIFFQGKVLNGVHYIDVIVYRKPFKS